MASSEDRSEGAAAPQTQAQAWPVRAWGGPLAALDRRWTRLEAGLCAAVLVAEIVALCVWISLKGLSTPPGVPDADGHRDVSGIVFRALITATAFGIAAAVATRKLAADGREKTRAIAVTSAIAFGLFAGWGWRDLGVAYFSNLLNWMQNASLLMLVGGLRGFVTRLTLWVALLGASIATAKGKHINIDVVMRFLTPRMRVPIAIVGWVAAAVMCFAGAWGFFDNIALASFDADRAGSEKASARIAYVAHEARKDLFLVGRQAALDVRTLPVVFLGKKYDTYWHAAEWNAWMSGADWTAYFAPADVEAQRMAPDDTNPRIPAINVPGGGSATFGLLVRDLNFIFPFGLLVIGIRFILRSLLALAGRVRVDPDAAHDDEDVAQAHLPEGTNGVPKNEGGT